MLDRKLAQFLENSIAPQIPFDLVPHRINFGSRFIQRKEVGIGFQAPAISDGLISQNLDEPRPNISAVEAAPRPECPQQAFLHEVFGIGFLAYHSACHPVENGQLGPDRTLKGGPPSENTHTRFCMIQRLGGPFSFVSCATY